MPNQLSKSSYSIGESLALGAFHIPSEKPLAPVDWIDEDCKQYWNAAVQSLGTAFEEHLRIFLTELGSILGVTTDLKVRVVVDTNAVISEILRLLNNRGPFLSKLTSSPFLDAIAPTEMEDELHEKITELFPDPSEQKRVFSIAESITGGIRFVEGFQISPGVREIALMEERDPDDVVFVQIAIEYNTQGVLTKDKAFENLGGIKKWELGEVGRIITEVNRGALTIWVTAVGFPLAAFTLIKLGMMLVALGFGALERITSAGIDIGKRIINGVIDRAKAAPLRTVAVVGLMTILAIFLYSWEPSRTVIDEVFNESRKAVDAMIDGAARIIQSLQDATQVLVDAAKDQIPSIVKWLDCLTKSSLLLLQRVNELEQVRVS